MNSKITFGELINLLATDSGMPRRVCEDFLKQLFNTVATTIEAGDSVRIKGFGTFKVTEVSARKSVNVTTGQEYEIPPHNRVTFLPAKELAALVNAPFEAFEAIELADGVTDEDLDAAAVGGESPQTENMELLPSPTAESDAEQEEEAQEDSDLEEYSIEELDAEQEVAEELAEEVADTSDYSDTSDNSYVPDKPRKGFRFGWGFVAGFASALVIGFGSWAVLNNLGVISGFAVAKTDKAESAQLPQDVTVSADADTENETAGVELLAEEAEQIKPVEKTEVKEQSGEKAVETSVSDAPVYDTISTTRYLTTMAKEHYGNYNLWPYIYKENEAILGHPDRIRPGTKVVIPKLSKYGVNPRNPDDVAKAKKMGVAIYARYN